MMKETPAPPRDEPPTDFPGSPGREPDWPWLFGPRFWTLAVGSTLLFALEIGLRSWSLATAEADPVELGILAPERALPGERIPIRAWVRDGTEHEPVADAALEVRLVGHRFRRKVASGTTDSKGRAVLEAPLPDSRSKEPWFLEVASRSPAGRARASQPLSLSRFELLLSLPKPTVVPGESIEVGVFACDAATRAPLADRPLQLEWTDANGHRILREQGTTSPSGFATLELKLPPNLGEGSHRIRVFLEGASVERELNVLPSSETSPARTRSVGRPESDSPERDPLRVEVLPESGTLVQGVGNTLFVFTSARNGRAAPAIVYTGGGTRVATNAFGVGHLQLTPGREVGKLTLSARSTSGTEVEVERNLPLQEQSAGLLLTLERAVHAPGESASVAVRTRSQASRVFLDLVWKGRVLRSFATDLTGGEVRVSLQLPPHTAGLHQLRAQALTRQG